MFARILMTLVAAIGALAMHFSTLQPDWLRLLLTVAFGGLALLVLLARRSRATVVAWCVSMTALVIWYVADRPSNDRDWEPEYAVPAMVHTNGRIVSVQNIRNFSYPSEAEQTPSYYSADFPLDDLITVDFISSYWSGDTIAHTFLTFGFRDGRHLAFSIETRRAKGVGYSTVAGFFHHYELFYVVADERDLIGVRTDVRREHVYLYRLHLKPEVREALFLSYIEKVRQIADHPEWYNTLTDNCTTGILNRAKTLGDISYNWRVLLSGYAAEYAYSLGLLDKRMTFANLRQASLIERPASATITDTYSHDIRVGLPLASE